MLEFRRKNLKILIVTFGRLRERAGRLFRIGRLKVKILIVTDDQISPQMSKESESLNCHATDVCSETKEIFRLQLSLSDFESVTIEICGFFSA
jgi:hypothetical protein